MSTQTEPPDRTLRRVLFLCTVNFYRSRFAEAVFNHHAPNHLPGHMPGWTAFSRGLAIHLAEGDLSPYTAEALEQRGIPLHRTAPSRQPLEAQDLEAAHLVIALDAEEHQPMVAARFPDWEERITFWDVADTHLVTPEAALPAIEQEVLALLRRLAED